MNMNININHFESIVKKYILEFVSVVFFLRLNEAEKFLSKLLFKPLWKLLLYINKKTQTHIYSQFIILRRANVFVNDFNILNS